MDKKIRRKRKIRLGIAVFIMIMGLASTGIYFGVGQVEQQEFKELPRKSLLDLYEKNPDLVGWIQIKGTNIDYPVMNNDYYLNRDFSGDYSRAGVPFLSDGCDNTNMNILVYGHNMNFDGNMFYQVTKYGDKDFWEKHKTIDYYAICEDTNGQVFVEKRTYRVMSAIKTETTSWKYWHHVAMDSREDLEKYASECRERQLYDTGVQLTDSVISLSTCSYHVAGKNGRMVVVGTLINTVEQDTLDEI